MSISVARATPVLRALVIAAVVVVVATVGYSIYVIGTPGQQRDLRLDQQRIDDLRNISNNINTYLELNEEMPPSLFEMMGPRYYVRSIEDPETGAPYAYRIIDGTDYELCAVFATASPNARPTAAPSRVNLGPRPGQDVLRADDRGGTVSRTPVSLDWVTPQ